MHEVCPERPAGDVQSSRGYQVLQALLLLVVVVVVMVVMLGGSSRKLKVSGWDYGLICVKSDKFEKEWDRCEGQEGSRGQDGTRNHGQSESLPTRHFLTYCGLDSDIVAFGYLEAKSRYVFLRTSPQDSPPPPAPTPTPNHLFPLSAAQRVPRPCFFFFPSVLFIAGSFKNDAARGKVRLVVN